MEGFSLFPTSRDSAECDEIVLRETKTTRLVFKPLLISNIHDASAAIKGVFVYQRRKRGESWTDLKTLNLSQLKADEWVQLELKATEVQKLVQRLNDLYAVHAETGIPSQPSHFVRLEAHLGALVDTDEKAVRFCRLQRSSGGLDIFTRVLRWVSKTPNTEDVLTQLESLGEEALQRLSTLSGIWQLKKLLAEWDANWTNAKEEYWQDLLSRNSFVFSQVFSFPVVILKGKAYLGGKGIGNTGGNVVDFLLTNKLTRNSSLVELKTPMTNIVGTKYRGIYNMSEEVTGAVMQVLNYKASLLREYDQLVNASVDRFEAFNPRCMVIAGNLSHQQLNKTQERSFELFRNSQKEVDIITYDELFNKVKILVDLLEGTSGS